MAEISGFVRRFYGHGASSAIFFAVEKLFVEERLWELNSNTF